MHMNKIKIGWKTYDIRKVEPQQTLFVGGNECYGTIDYVNQVIDINSKCDDEQSKATLIHEVIHGVSDMYALKFDEDTVGRLGDALYTLLKDNNLEIKYFNKESE